MANEKTIVADVDGTLVSWSDGYFSSSDRILLNKAKENAQIGDTYREIIETNKWLIDGEKYYTTQLARGGREILAGNQTPLHAASAIMLINPGRTTFPVVNNAEDLEKYFENASKQEENYIKSTLVSEDDMDLIWEDEEQI